MNDEILSPIGGVVADIRTLSRHPLSITRTQQVAIRTAFLRCVRSRSSSYPRTPTGAPDR